MPYWTTVWLWGFLFGACFVAVLVGCALVAVVYDEIEIQGPVIAFTIVTILMSAKHTIGCRSH